MTKDFFEVTESSLAKLNQTEKQLFEYVVKNMNGVKDMSIQKFAEEQFLSTTTIFRFVQKLGFGGYTEFINSLLVTAYNKQDVVIPNAILKQGYSEEYLKNIIETARVMAAPEIKKLMEVLWRRPSIYILTDDNTHPIAQYSEKLFIGLGLHAYAPEATYQMQNLVNRINSEDLLIALSYSGEDQRMIRFIEKVFLRERPFLMSITRADNNILESLSDTNFYIFAEEIRLNEMDLTSCIPMLAILELLVYAFIQQGAAEGE